MGCSFFADFINGALCFDSFCRLLFIFQVQKNVIFNYRWCPGHISPFMPTLGIECKILAWMENMCSCQKRHHFKKVTFETCSVNQLGTCVLWFWRIRKVGPSRQFQILLRKLAFAERFFWETMQLMDESHKCNVENTHSFISLIWRSITCKTRLCW